MSTRATAQGDDLVKALRTALGDLFDHDVKVQVDLPRDADISDVSVTVEASVEWPTKEQGTDAASKDDAPREAQSSDQEGEQPEPSRRARPPVEGPWTCPAT